MCSSIFAAGKIDRLTNQDMFKKAFSGPKVTNKLLQGKVILLAFLKNGDKKALASIADIQSLQDQYQASNKLQVLVSFSDDESAEIKKIISSNKLTVPVYSRLFFEDLNVIQFPFYVLLDKKGEVLKKGNFNLSEVKKVVEAAPPACLSHLDIKFHGKAVKKYQLGKNCKNMLDGLLAHSKKNPDSASAKEAGAIYEGMLVGANQEVVDAAELSPLEAYDRYSMIAKTYVGFDAAKESLAKRAAMKKEKGFLRLSQMRIEFNKQKVKKRLSSRSLKALLVKAEDYVDKEQGIACFVKDAALLRREVEQLLKK